jgi:hypothetical protein
MSNGMGYVISRLYITWFFQIFDIPKPLTMIGLWLEAPESTYHTLSTFVDTFAATVFSMCCTTNRCSYLSSAYLLDDA